MIRNNISVGIPIRNEVLLEMILMKSRSEPSNKIFSDVNDMGIFLLNNKGKNPDSGNSGGRATAERRKLAPE